MQFRFALLLAAVCVPAVHAGVIYNETVNGDFANSGLTPTGGLVAAAGSNQILGTTGNTGTPDRDYFTVTIPTGLQLNAITVLPGTTAGNVSFIGVQAGNQGTLPVTTATAAGLSMGPSSHGDAWDRSAHHRCRARSLREQ